MDSQLQDGFAELRRAMRRRFGESVAIENIEVPSLGGSNRTVLFDLIDGSTRKRVVSRQRTYEGADSPFLDAAQQFLLMEIAHREGVPVPEPILLFSPEDQLGDGFASAFVVGETMPKRIIERLQHEQTGAEFTRQLGRVLARLHQVRAETTFLHDIPDSIDAIDAQRQRYDSYDEPHPAIELGFRWLERNRPKPATPVLLHGDFRNGNLMVGNNRVVAVLDWECAHLGSPAEDIGWLTCRPWRFGRTDQPVGGFGQLADLLASYHEAGGAAIDASEVQYWQVFGLLRWAVINMMQAHGHLFGNRRDPVFAACGRNTSLIEYDLLMTLKGLYR